MDSNLTLIASVTIAGIFLVGVVTYHGKVVEYSQEETFELLTQESMVAYIDVIEYDFNRIGSGVLPGTVAITAIDTSGITFRGDVQGAYPDKTPETVTYSISNKSAASSTANPNDVILYRTVNGVHTIDSPGGITQLYLRYYDVTGNQTAVLRDIRSIGIRMIIESVHEYNGRYARAVWEKRITPANLAKASIYDSGS